MLIIYTLDIGIDIPFAKIDKIYFGNNESDVNMCNLGSQFYKVKGGVLPNLDLIANNNFTLTLESNTPHALRDLNLTFSIHNNELVRMQYSYANFSGVDNVPY